MQVFIFESTEKNLPLLGRAAGTTPKLSRTHNLFDMTILFFLPMPHALAQRIPEIREAHGAIHMSKGVHNLSVALVSPGVQQAHRR